MNSKKRAYVSVYNKERIVEFCQYLIDTAMRSSRRRGRAKR